MIFLEAGDGKGERERGNNEHFHLPLVYKKFIEWKKGKKKKKGRKDPSLHEYVTSHWLHGNSIPKIGLPLFLAWTNSPS